VNFRGPVSIRVGEEKGGEGKGGEEGERREGRGPPRVG